MNLENKIINYIDKVVKDHPEIPSYILQTILEDICSIIKDDFNITLIDDE